MCNWLGSMLLDWGVFLYCILLPLYSILMCKLLSFAVIKNELKHQTIRQLAIHVVEDSSEYCISHDGNRDGERQDPWFLKVKNIFECITRFFKIKNIIGNIIKCCWIYNNSLNEEQILPVTSKNCLQVPLGQIPPDKLSSFSLSGWAVAVEPALSLSWFKIWLKGIHVAHFI